MQIDIVVAHWPVDVEMDGRPGRTQIRREKQKHQVLRIRNDG